jgi:hypothetical protein
LLLVLVFSFLNRARCYVATSEDNAGSSATKKHAGGTTRWFSSAGDASAEGDTANITPSTAATNTSAAGTSLETGYCK